MLSQAAAAKPDHRRLDEARPGGSNGPSRSADSQRLGGRTAPQEPLWSRILLIVSESAATLAAAMAQHQIELPEAQMAQLDRYCQLLWQWNEKMNLTRHDTYDKFVGRDLIDSLAFAEFLGQGETVLDVGTGGGVPGIVLAVVRPDLKISLCESVGKKARAVAEMVGTLNLNVPVYSSRAEEILNDVPFNTLVIRAVARMEKLLRWFRPHWQHCDRLLILKGPGWVEERGEARHLGLMNKLALRKLKAYPLPGTDSESVLLQICLQDRLEAANHCRLGGYRHPRCLDEALAGALLAVFAQPQPLMGGAEAVGENPGRRLSVGAIAPDVGSVRAGAQRRDARGQPVVGASSARPRGPAGPAARTARRA